MARIDETLQQSNVSKVLQLVSFRIGQEEFGLDILKVKEINRMVEITRIPNAPGFISGVINLRGKVIPIVDLRVRFGIQRREFDRNTRIIVVDLSEFLIGFVVDAVTQVLRIPAALAEQPPSMAVGIDSEYITAVCKLQDRLLILVDFEKVLHKEDRSRCSEFAA
jgi:purine-binding chemotaxis protein CheW